MVFAAVLLFFQAPTLEQIDKLAKAKDAAGLTALVTLPKGVDNPFNVLQTGGAYDVGRFGWHAEALKAPGGAEYVVIGTPLTSQDVGEILLKRVGGHLVYIPEQNELGVHLISHDFDLSFDIAKKTAFLQDRLTFRSTGKGDWIFRMSPNYRVSAIRDAYDRPVPFAQASGVVSVPKPTGISAVYKVRYSAVVNMPMYAGSISESEATLVNDYWYPMVARQPSTYDIKMRLPKGWWGVAQGNRQPSEPGTLSYKMPLPVTYFSVVAMKGLKESSMRSGANTYRVWSPRMSEADMKIHQELMAPVVEFYSKTFGKWPFAGYGAVDSPHYGGGALEAYSFATYGGGLPDQDAHEPAHTLWGGVINNTYLNSFWNESFAVFSDGLFHRECPIGNRAERQLAFISTANASESYNAAPVFDSGAFKGGIGSDLGYGKGAFVLQMLEQWLGTDETTACMAEWLRVQTRAVPGNWEDFERVVAKRNPGKDVTGFFDDWGRRPGYADFSANVSYQNDATIIRLSWKGPHFRMPLTILRNYSFGKNKFDTVWLDGSNDVIRLDGPQPSVVSLDPWRQALRKVAQTETPVELEWVLPGLKKVTPQPGLLWAEGYGANQANTTPTDEPEGKFLVGSPENWPLMQRLCEQVGFHVEGSKLTYDGTTIDLNQGAAFAVIDLPNGKRCAIGLGKVEHREGLGHARLALVDRLGRLLRATTDPKRSGPLTYKL